MAQYRAEELAETADISVALLRSYQSKGLLPAPRHVGRTAVYGDHHLERLRWIVALKARGHSLRSIAEQLEAPHVRVLDPAGERFRLRDVSERSGVPIEMLRSMEASGLLRPRPATDGAGYTDADVRAVGCLLLLVGSGIPFDRFLEVAEPQLRSIESMAGGAVGLFERHVVPQLEGEDAVAEALAAMAGAIGEMVAYLVERHVIGAWGESPEGHAESDLERSTA